MGRVIVLCGASCCCCGGQRRHLAAAGASTWMDKSHLVKEGLGSWVAVASNAWK